MTKDEVMKFLDTATPEVFAEIRARMAQINRDRKFGQYIAKRDDDQKRKLKIISLRQSGMRFDDIGKMYNITGARCREIFNRHMTLRKHLGD